jgi:SAM-dependent methyltransferase
MTDRSVSFDRAAEFYDRTRTYGELADRDETRILAAELRTCERVLEIGVGTGQVGLRLHGAGVQIFGVDLSTAMLRRLVEKSGGSAPFPVVVCDATQLPFRDGSFDGLVLRHVLHLVPAWHEAVSEIGRVSARPGLVLISHGESELGRAVRIRAEEILGRPIAAVGLDWHSWWDLEGEMRRVGGSHRALGQIAYRIAEPLMRLVEGIRDNVFSWTWGFTDDERSAIGNGLRPWLEERFGGLDAPLEHEETITWHAYDLR